MRSFFSHILGGIIRWAVGVIIATTFLMLGFSPENWIKGVVETPPAWLVSDLTRFALVAIGVFTIVCVFFWDRSIRQKNQQVNKKPDERASSIKMTVGENGAYFDIEGDPYAIRRTFNLKLENIDLSKPVSNCSVKILSITPPTDSEGPWLLKEGILLAAGDHVFIPLVTYGEARNPDKYPCGDSFMTMGTADKRPLLDVGNKYTVTIRATAPETPYCDFQCKIWDDDRGQLKIEG